MSASSSPAGATTRPAIARRPAATTAWCCWQSSSSPGTSRSGSRVERRLERDTLDAGRRAGQSARVDPELVGYFDRRFTELKHELKSELKSELSTELTASLTSSLTSSLTASLTTAITSAVMDQLRVELAASAAETRRHFDVVADRLMDKIQLVGEGVIGVDQKLDRFRGEVAEEFRKVDRRLLRLEARVIG